MNIHTTLTRKRKRTHDMNMTINSTMRRKGYDEEKEEYDYYVK